MPPPRLLASPPEALSTGCRPVWHQPSVAYALGVLIFVVLSGIPIVGFNEYDRAVQANDEARRQARADRLATVAKVEVERVFDILAFVAQYAAEEDQGSVERALTRAHRLLPGAMSLNLIDERRVVRFVTPLADNQAALGQRVGQSPAILDMLDESARTGSPRVTPPVALFQGGQGVVTYFPFRRHGDFAGFINCVFDPQALLNAMDWDIGADAAIVVTDGAQALGLIGDAGDRFSAVTRTVAVLDRDWTLSVRESASAAPGLRVAAGVMTTGIAFGSICAVLIIVALRQRAVASERAEAQAHAERLLATVVQHVPGVVFQSRAAPDGSDFRYTYLSDRVSDLFGCTPEQAYRDPTCLLARIHPDDRETFLLGRRHEEGSFERPRSTEYRILGPAGVSWFRATRWFRKQPDGTIVADGLNTDVTQEKLAEAELIRSREQLLEAQRVGRTGIIDDDYVTGRVTWSDTVFELRGVPPRACFTRAESLSYIHPDDRDAYVEARNAAIDARRDFVCDVRFLRSDGSFCWQHTIGHPRFDETGRCVGMLFVVRDITDVRAAQEALRLSEERHQLAVQGMREGLFDCDYRADVMWFSTRVHEIVGLPDGALNRDRAIYAGLIHSDDRAAYEAERRRIAESRAPDGSIKVRLRRSDGAWRSVVVRGVAIHDETGLARSVGSIGDVTDQEEAAKALRLSEERYALLVEGNREGVFDRDYESDTGWFSARVHEILGLPDGELNGTLDTIRAYCHPDDHRAGREESRRAIRRRDRYLSTTRRLRHADGSWRWIVTRGCIIYDDRGRPVRAVGSFGDITDLKLAQSAAQTSEKLAALGRLTGGVAHDMNNVFSVIRLGLECLDGSPDATGESTGIVRSMARATEQGARLANELLSFARRRAMDARSIDLNKVVATALDLFRPTVGAKYEVTAELAADGSAARIDRSLFETTLLNLLLNARDAMPDGGDIVVGTRNCDLVAGTTFVSGEAAAGRYIAVSVRDRGQGFADAVIDKVFDPFFTTKGDRGGTGLGLSMVFGFVKQSHGHIAIQNDDAGGAVIEMFFPVCRAEDRVAPPAPPARRPRARGTALIVEDRSDLRMMVARLCRGLGYEIREAASVGEARRILGSADPVDVMLTDVVLGDGETGFDLARQTLTERPATRVVVMSGYSETPLPRDLERRGVAFLQKPLSTSELEAVLAG